MEQQQPTAFQQIVAAHPQPDAITMDNFQAQLRDFAVLEHELNERKAVADEMRFRFWQTYVLPYEKEILEIEKEIKDRGARLDACMAAYIYSTGDKDADPHYSVKKKPVEWDYDAERMLEEAVKHNATQFYRTSYALNKNEFKEALAKMWDSREPSANDWMIGEPIYGFTIKRQPLGDLLIEID